jgi:phosphohistidine phosphatase
MKTLYLMRHAEAATGSPDGQDHSRPLTDLGRAQAARAAAFIKTLPQQPDSAIASDSLRTKDTAKIVHKAGISFQADLYLASADRLLAAIQGVDQKYNTLLVVAHNPGVGELALRLADKRYDDLISFPPATIAVLTTDADDWYDIDDTNMWLQDVFEVSKF